MIFYSLVKKKKKTPRRFYNIPAENKYNKISNFVMFRIKVLSGLYITTVYL